MPVGKPTEDGEITLGSRHSTAHGTLGTPLAWVCPACGKRNEGRRIEQGCGVCGSGDPLKSQAGTAQVSPERAAASSTEKRGRPPQIQNGGPRSAESIQPRVDTTRIYRLIEYVITHPRSVQTVLRNSLVGRLEMDWGTITGTIVDTLDPQQEDRLRMARMQPGVWLANVEAMNAARPLQVNRRASTSAVAMIEENRDATEYFAAAREERERRMEMPDTGPAFTDDDVAIAKNITRLWGLKFAHTLALALSNVSIELEGNMEPEKFLSSEECQRLSNALMSLIPADWNPQEGSTDDAANTP